jgi:hypothetical protein
MGGGADQDRLLTDNNLYAALLDTGHAYVLDKEKAYKDADEGRGDTSDGSLLSEH